MLILASNSPRRKQLLGLGGWAFRVMPAEIDERPFPGESPRVYVLRLAQSKARAAARQAPEEAIILAADTTVVDRNSEDDPGGGEILGKPESEAEAAHMLRRLRGRTHLVFTALAVLRVRDGQMHSEVCRTDVPMRAYSEEEIAAYVASGDALDKAGAYAIQHAGFHPVESLEGCYANVVGLPLCHLMRSLAKFDMAPAGDLPSACQEALHYQCPVYAQILAGEI